MFFDHISQAPADPVFGLLGVFAADPRPQKVDLMVGIYKDNDLRSEMIPSVKKAKEQIHDTTADYLPIDGLKEMTQLLGPLVFGQLYDQSLIYAAHTAGGTAALRVGADFIAQEVTQLVAIPQETWPNHQAIFERARMKIEHYPYYNQSKKGFNLDAMVHFLEKLPEKSAVILHACCHNPTGCDPTLDEWKEISRVMKRKRLLPFFDFAYQGFGMGIEKDAEAVRLFMQDGHEMLVAYSCSKNFSMYCQRVGALFVVSRAKNQIASQVKRIIRALYSNPPAHGARIVAEILNKESLRRVWQKDLSEMRERLHTMRQTFVDRLNQFGDYDYLRSHKGMFSFIDLSKAQVQRLIDEFGVYLLANGRISVAGLTTENIDYVVESVTKV